MLVWHVAECDYSKVGQASLRTHRSKLGIVDHDFVSRKLIGPGLNLGKSVIQPGFGMLWCIAGRLGHVSIVIRAARQGRR